MVKISIPKPCHQNWDEMTEAAKGRFCSVCATVVTDFTAMSDAAIKQFFLEKKEEKICGRFQQHQLSQLTINLPASVLIAHMPVWKKFLAACLLVFSTTLFGCNTTIQGKPAPAASLQDTIHTTTAIEIINDTLKQQLPKPPVLTTVLGTPVATITQPTIKGEIEYIPDTFATAAKDTTASAKTEADSSACNKAFF